MASSRIVEIAIDHGRRSWNPISMKLETAALQLEALGNPTRLQIYRTLVRAGRGGMAVGQVQEKVGLPASTLSHHLKRLLDRGLVRQERAGTSLICHAEYPAMTALLGFLADECCADDTCAPAAAGETTG
jgi:ArsR family transcriptional regulator, arsenate/arsenite/antimonite-responsive transcriptional repressor